ncbi:MAG: hypothetical protein ACOYL6_15335 [Bacteriovoracaceae bacterium]
MKVFTLALLALTVSGAMAQEAPQYNGEEISPLKADLLGVEDRLIEPTSVVLGKKLAAQIRLDQRHPDEIIDSIKKDFPNYKKDLQLSSIIYFKTLLPSLQKYCTTDHKEEEASERDIKQVEQGAIPLSILKPLHTSYLENLNIIRTNYVEKNEAHIEKLAGDMARAYQHQRYDCLVVHKLGNMEKKAKKNLPGRLYDRLIDLNHKISSPEASFPRIQFSINGLTQYVYNEIMKLPLDRLNKLLKTGYDAEIAWRELKRTTGTKERYFTAIEREINAAGFMPREALLFLAYSTRNMASVDVHYGYDTDKALLLEVYFWKMHDIRNDVQSKYLPDIFPNKVMKANPGLYHYATASLLACDIRLHGYSGAMAKFLALFNKVGYKVHKLFGELANGNKEGKRSLKSIHATAKAQGFGPGVLAGRYGGRHGVKYCRKNTPKEFWFKHEALSAPEGATAEEKNIPAELLKENLDPSFDIDDQDIDLDGSENE